MSEIALMVGFAGVAFIMVALYILIKQRAIQKNGEYVDAVVVRTEKRYVRAEPDPVFYPIFQFQANGQVQEAEHWIGSRRQKYEDGETVRIIYNKNNIDKINIAGDKTAFIGSFVLGLVGVITLAVGVLLTTI